MKKKNLFSTSVSCLDELCHGVPLPSVSAVPMMELLTLFSSTFSLLLSSLHDAELKTHCPFSMEDLSGITLRLCDLFVTLFLEKQLSPDVSSFICSSHKSLSRPFPHEWKVLTKVYMWQIRKIMHA